MLVAGIMKRSVVTINPLATVREALMVMKESGVKSLLSRSVIPVTPMA